MSTALWSDLLHGALGGDRRSGAVAAAAGIGWLVDFASRPRAQTCSPQQSMINSDWSPLRCSVLKFHYFLRIAFGDS